MRLAILATTTLAVGTQIFFISFLLSVIGLRWRDGRLVRERVARLGVATCVVLAAGSVIWQAPQAIRKQHHDAQRWATMNFEDREFGVGNSIIPDKHLLYEARADSDGRDLSRRDRPPSDSGCSLAYATAHRGLRNHLFDAATSVGDRALDHLPWLRHPQAGCPCADRLVEQRRQLAAPSRRMTLHAIGGLFALNLLLLLAGAGALWAIRGWATWVEFARLGGLAYLLGLSLVGTLLVLELELRIQFGLATVLATAFGVAVAGAVIGRVLGRPRPRSGLPIVNLGRGPLLVTALGAGTVLVFLEALFRAGRLAPLLDWDGMAVWVPKAQAIYYFGGLDHQFFAILPNPSYPPLIPAVEASAFEFMGGPDPITLHLLFWFPLVAFLAAVVGLLAPRVHAWILWPSVLLLCFSPVVVGHALSPTADLMLDYFVALGTLLLALWLLERSRWQLVLAACFFASALLTKREGLLLVACILVCLVAVTWSLRRAAWLGPPRLSWQGSLSPGTSGWRRATSQGPGPDIGYFGFLHHLNLAWPSTRLTLTALFDGPWSLVPVVIVVAIVAGLVRGKGGVPAFAGAWFVLGTLACSWVTLSYPGVPLVTNNEANPIVRLTGGLVIPAAVLLPLVLNAAWHGRATEPVAVTTLRKAAHSRSLALVIVVLAAVTYPLVVLAQGLRAFILRAECVVPAKHDGNVELVFGKFESYAPASALLKKIKNSAS